MLEGRIEELEARLTDLRDRTLADIRWEEHLAEAYWAFRRPDLELGALIQAWVDSSPGSAAAHIALAKHTMARAWTVKDGRAGVNIPKDELGIVHELIAHADQAVELALALDPENLAAHSMRLEVLQLWGSPEERVTATQTALRIFPTSFVLRRQALTNASPVWEGSIELMEALVEDAETRATGRNLPTRGVLSS